MFIPQEGIESPDHLVTGLLFEQYEMANPSHYKKGVSPYDVAKTMYGAEGLLQFVTINAVKYVSRYPHKHKGNSEQQLADLVKARQSLDTAIELHKEIYGNKVVRHG
tara:strand:+ start:351 stop:671 length:321 start_codon:yes stop_codon:yes gene_type:complete